MPAPLARRWALQVTQVIADLLQCCLLLTQREHDENRRALTWFHDDMSGQREAPAVAQALWITVIGSVSSQFSSALSLSLARSPEPANLARLIQFITLNSLHSMSEHPRPSGWRAALQGLCARCLSATGARFAGAVHVTAAAALRTSRLMCAALVARPGVARRCAHHGESRCRGESHRVCAAIRTRYGQVAFRDAAQHVRGAVVGTMEFIDGHQESSSARRPTDAARVSCRAMGYEATARSLPPRSINFGPSALIEISKSKIPVGSHRVAHAFGISTMPLMCPSTGAVPRIA